VGCSDKRTSLLTTIQITTVNCFIVTALGSKYVLTFNLVITPLFIAV